MQKKTKFNLTIDVDQEYTVVIKIIEVIFHYFLNAMCILIILITTVYVLFVLSFCKVTSSAFKVIFH